RSASIAFTSSIAAVLLIHAPREHRLGVQQRPALAEKLLDLPALLLGDREIRPFADPEQRSVAGHAESAPLEVRMRARHRPVLNEQQHTDQRRLDLAVL